MPKVIDPRIVENVLDVGRFCSPQRVWKSYSKEDQREDDVKIEPMKHEASRFR
ncbi:MAG: hypothetical protein HP494_03395 [Nitrospira sp.]|nr:hypothetical protein [Nitrospira sp.]